MRRSKQAIYTELLVVRCQRQDQSAWEELVQLWNRPLFYYLRRLLDQEEDAWNVLHEVWVKVLAGLRGLRDTSRFAPWIYSIARHTAMSHWRQRYAEPQQNQDLLDVEGEEDSQLAHLENAEFVHHGLGKIDLPEREILTLFFLQDLTIAEIAQVLEIPPGTVKSRLFKARKDLRRVLEMERADDGST